MNINNNYQNILKSNDDLNQRIKNTDNILSSLLVELNEKLKNENSSLSVFSAGSIGRHEIGKFSDIDPFILADFEISQTDEERIKTIINKTVKEKNFPDITEDFFKIYYMDDLLKLTGRSEDDHENTFTTRILMLLESLPIYNKNTYITYRKKIVKNYFRDSTGRPSEFKPVFLLNDFLRYWRTVCLNYEKLRNEPDMPWRKKNINLKFARRFTIFSTILPMISKPIRSVDEFIDICDKTPMERLSYGLDIINDPLLEDRYKIVINNYVTFLKLKEEPNIEESLDIVNPKIKEMDEYNKKFLFDVLMHKNIEETYKHYLVL
ncbi:MAG: hypothetical protein OEY89_07015 [Gammaproteobacteria bacterium]|nr:hypothetical protein [Gammaproteobacteria bacterium]